MSDSITYAIDFGTSNSLLSAVKEGVVIDPLVMDIGNSDPTVLRSLMYFPKSGEPSFGGDAIEKYIDESGEGRFIRSIKKYLPMESFVATSINNKPYTLEELISRFLSEMKKRADTFFETDVKRVVLGRPAKFATEASRDKLAELRLQQAARLAGFTDIDFLPEPLAAAAEFRGTIQGEKTVLVVDLGGGTSDFTIIKIHAGPFQPSDVLAIGGVSVAGDALDGCIMGNKIATHFGSEVQYRFPMSENILSMPPSLKFNLMSPADITLMSRSDIMSFLNEVKKCTVNDKDLERMDNLFELIGNNLGFAIFEEIERCKREVGVKSLVDFKFDQDDLFVTDSLSEVEFVDYSKESILSIFNCLENVVSQAQLKNEDIDLICCTGGTSKVPLIRSGLEKRFEASKIQSFKSFHSVIRGLAEHAKGQEN